MASARVLSPLSTKNRSCGRMAWKREQNGHVGLDHLGEHRLKAYSGVLNQGGEVLNEIIESRVGGCSSSRAGTGLIVRHWPHRPAYVVGACVRVGYAHIKAPSLAAQRKAHMPHPIVAIIWLFGP